MKIMRFSAALASAAMLTSTAPAGQKLSIPSPAPETQIYDFVSGDGRFGSPALIVTCDKAKAVMVSGVFQDTDGTEAENPVGNPFTAFIYRNDRGDYVGKKAVMGDSPSPLLVDLAPHYASYLREIFTQMNDICSGEIPPNEDDLETDAPPPDKPSSPLKTRLQLNTPASRNG